MSRFISYASHMVFAGYQPEHDTTYLYVALRGMIVHLLLRLLQLKSPEKAFRLVI
jgi:hypothetical protein